MRVSGWAAVSLVLTACSSSSGGQGAPICSKNTVQLSGTIDGASANGSYSGPSGYVFVNALGSGQPGTIDVGFGTGGKLHLQWATLVADDQSVSATGTLTMPMEGPHPGQLYCVSSASLTPRTMSEGGGVSFTLSSLSKGACPGTATSGSLEGCAAGSF